MLQSVKIPLPDPVSSGKFFQANSIASYPASRCFNPLVSAPRSIHTPIFSGHNPWEANNIVKNFLKLIWAKSTKPFVIRSYQDPNDAKLFNVPKGLYFFTFCHFQTLHSVFWMFPLFFRKKIQSSLKLPQYT